MAAFETRAAQTTSTAAGIVPEDFRADQFVEPRCACPGDARSLGREPLPARGNVVIPKFKSDMSAGWVCRE